MDWEIALSRQAEKFLAKNHLPDEFVTVPVFKAIRKFFGESVVGHFEIAGTVA